MMKRILLICLVFSPFFLNAQVSDNFSDGDFITTPTWSGDNASFTIVDVSGNKMLRSANEVASSKYYLSTPSTTATNSQWEFYTNLQFNTSSANYVDVFLLSDKATLSATGINGYFVRIGNTADEISLYKRVNGVDTKIIDGEDNITNTSINILKIRVTRDENNVWLLERDVTGSGTTYVTEGYVTDASILTSTYFGFFIVQSTASFFDKHFFDDIYVGPIADTNGQAPTIPSVNIVNGNQLKVDFSERVDFSTANFTVSNIGIPTASSIAIDKKSITLTFTSVFAASTIYTLYADNIVDLSGNTLTKNDYIFGVVENPAATDIVINEIMYNNPDATEEYVEIFNTTDKFLTVSGVRITKKANGKLTATTDSIPKGTTLYPKGYLALCKTPNVVKNYYTCPDTSKFAAMDKSLTSLTNEGATLVLFKINTNDTIRFDSLTYSPKWQYPLIKDDQGVALERINPYAATQSQSNWHSASSEVKYGTPGYKNSQYRLPETTTQEKSFWLENDVFTPDNDGNNDILILHYKMPDNGYMTNITIYDAVGQTVKSLVSSYLLATDGTISWDGSTDKGTAANIGVYVIFADVYNATTGKMIRQKIPCVVSTR